LEQFNKTDNYLELFAILVEQNQDYEINLKNCGERTYPAAAKDVFFSAFK